MKVSPEFITHILKTYGSSPAEISSGMGFYEDIEKTIKVAREKQRELCINFDTQNKIWEDKITEAKKRCDHPAFAVSHHSECEDRYRECGICGKTF